MKVLSLKRNLILALSLVGLISLTVTQTHAGGAHSQGFGGSPTKAQLDRMTEADLESSARFHGFSSWSEMQSYLTLEVIEIHDIAPNVDTLKAYEKLREMDRIRPPGRFDPLDTVNVDGSLGIEQWVSIGMKVWEVVANNRPVANVSTARISVLPIEQKDWLQMENWQGPSSKSFRLTAKNTFGMTVLDHRYTVAYNFGGQHNGKGQFIGNATLIPSSTTVSWGFTLNSTAEAGAPVNMGTKELPMAGLELQLKWKMNSVMKAMEGTEAFFIKGNGDLVRVAGSGQ